MSVTERPLMPVECVVVARRNAVLANRRAATYWPTRHVDVGLVPYTDLVRRPGVVGWLLRLFWCAAGYAPRPGSEAARVFDGLTVAGLRPRLEWWSLGYEGVEGWGAGMVVPVPPPTPGDDSA